MSEMLSRCGEEFYWATTILAGLIAVMAIANYYSSASQGEAILPIAALLVAGVIWLIGWIGRNMLSDT
jgi:hypothetical protein